MRRVRLASRFVIALAVLAAAVFTPALATRTFADSPPSLTAGGGGKYTTMSGDWCAVC